MEREIERLQRILTDLIKRRNRLMREGKYVQASNVSADIAKVEKDIKRTEDEMRPRPLSELLPQEVVEKSQIFIKVLRLHLLADIVDAACYDIVDTIKAWKLPLDLYARSDFEMLHKAAQSVARIVADMENLGEVVIKDDLMIEGLIKKIDKYMGAKIKQIYKQ